MPADSIGILSLAQRVQKASEDLGALFDLSMERCGEICTFVLLLNSCPALQVNWPDASAPSNPQDQVLGRAAGGIRL